MTNKKGYTLIEIVAAMALLGLASVTFYGAAGSGRRLLSARKEKLVEKTAIERIFGPLERDGIHIGGVERVGKGYLEYKVRDNIVKLRVIDEYGKIRLLRTEGKDSRYIDTGKIEVTSIEFGYEANAVKMELRYLYNGVEKSALRSYPLIAMRMMK